MSELDTIVAQAKAEGPRPVYLFSGDEFLVKQATEQLIDALVPESARDFNLSLLDGADADAKAISSHLAQAPMFRGTKLVVVRETTLLTGKSDLADEVGRALQLFSDGKEKDAARRMLAVLGKARWTIEDLTEASKTRWQKDLGMDLAEVSQDFREGVRELAERENLKIPESETGTLEKLLQGGAPPLNALVLTALKPDKRLSLTKLVAKLGVHLHLVPEQKGRGVETLDIGAVTGTILSRYGKRLQPAAETALKRALGGEMRLLSSELEKLCLYVGDRQTITADDVTAVGVSQIREEAFWELGSAVVERDLRAALWYLHDAFDHRRHPIPMVASIAGSLRRALQVRSVAEQHRVRKGTRNLPPAVVSEVAALRGGRKPHPFALLKEWERSLKWAGTASLTDALTACRDADRDLKTSRGDPRLVVERLVMRLCAR